MLNYASYIDHTALKPETRKADILKLCEEAAKYSFAAVCVNPVWVRTAHSVLRGTTIKVASVIGFPFGTQNTVAKAFEAKVAEGDGASEFDMVINVGMLKDHDYDAVIRDVEAVVKMVPPNTVKVIIETCNLTDDEKRISCLLAEHAGAHFVKTSTGFGASGATVQDVMLMKSVIAISTEVKASGGIRDANAMLQMIEAGASRIGTSSGVKIMEEFARMASKS
jgi:deoxyribose-phosphate aldolase